MCPRCRTFAPIVYRGLLAYCTACGAPRTPLVSPSVNLAGKPAAVGGTLARVSGWLALGFGMATAAGCGLFFYEAVSANAGLAVGLPIAIVSAVVGMLLLRGGSSLKQSAGAARTRAKEEAIFALAATRGGILSALDVAAALSLPHDEADQALTELASRMPDRTVLEIDEREGSVYFKFPHFMQATHAPPRVRIEPSPVGTETAESAELADDEVLVNDYGVRVPRRGRSSS